MFESPNAKNSKTTRILNHLNERIDARYGSRTEGTNRLIAMALRMEDMAMAEVKGKFTTPELYAIVDNANGVMIGEREWGRLKYFLMGLEDAFELDGIGERWGVDFNVISRKLESLSPAAFLFLHESLYRFWNERPAYGSPAPDLEQFVKDFGA